MYEELTQKAILWQAYAVAAVQVRFGAGFIRKGKSGDYTIAQEVLDEFALLCAEPVVWDERLAHWRVGGEISGPALSE
jgi:hypothetical protein